eukprot:56585-Heterocapsa_arctica.AAC.1
MEGELAIKAEDGSQSSGSGSAVGHAQDPAAEPSFCKKEEEEEMENVQLPPPLLASSSPVACPCLV